MINSDISVSTSQNIIKQLTNNTNIEKMDELIFNLKELLQKMYTEDQSYLKFLNSGNQKVITFFGVNGGGKTTSVAKLTKIIFDLGQTPLLVAADTFRKGAIEQLEIWAKSLNAECITGEYNSDPAAVVYKAIERAEQVPGSVLLIDTAGRLHTEQNLMQQLTKLSNVIQKRANNYDQFNLLVLDAKIGQNSTVQARIFHELLNCSGIILTKFDKHSFGGAVIDINHQLKIPVWYIGTGEGIEDISKYSHNDWIEKLLNKIDV